MRAAGRRPGLWTVTPWIPRVTVHVHAISRGSGRSEGSGGGLEAAQEGGVAGDGQAAVAGLGRGEVGREQAEDEPRGSLQDQVGGWCFAERGADLAAGDLDDRGTPAGAQLDRERRPVRIAVV